MPMKLYTWNVNGMRAALRNGFMDWLDETKPDVLCLQETKAMLTDIPDEARAPKGYESVWHSAQKKGYSGVAVYFKTRKKPENISPLGADEFDSEGRVQLIEYPEFVIVNAYWPNSQPERKRLDYKLRFGEAMANVSKSIRKKGKAAIFCGDFNIAHKEIDLARPKPNRNNPGFYPEECAFMDTFMNGGHVDVFREQHPDEEGHYSWWSYRGQARAKNIGWRLDYHVVTEDFTPEVKRADIHADVRGSDHCPVSLVIK